MTRKVLRLSALLLLTGALACPAATPAMPGLDFACEDSSQCAAGYLCVQARCVPASRVDAALGSDAGARDGAQRDAVTADALPPDIPSPDSVASDSAVLDGTPADGPLVDAALQDVGPGDDGGPDAGGLDQGWLDGPPPDADTGDAASSDGPVPDVSPVDSEWGDLATDDGAMPDVVPADTSGEDGAPDAGGVADASAPDAVLEDARVEDAAVADTWVDDAWAEDAFVEDARVEDAQVLDAGPCQRPALAFDGVDDRVNVADDSVLDKLQRFTIEAWIYPRDLSREVQIVSHHNHDTFKGWVLLVKDRYLELRIYDGSQMLHVWASDALGRPQLVEHAWQHVAGVYDGSELRLYANGALQHRVAAAISETKECGAPLRIGMAASVDMFHFDGFIDEVQLSSVARYTGSFTPPAAAPAPDTATLALWHGTEGSGQQLTDVGPYGLHGVLGSSSSAEVNDPLWTQVDCVADRVPAPLSCAALFVNAPGYQLCQEDAQSCGINVNTAGSTCGAWCPALGATCLGAIDNGAACEPTGNPNDTCDSPRSTELCLCSHPMPRPRCLHAATHGIAEFGLRIAD